MLPTEINKSYPDRTALMDLLDRGGLEPVKASKALCPSLIQFIPTSVALHHSFCSPFLYFNLPFTLHALPHCSLSSCLIPLWFIGGWYGKKAFNCYKKAENEGDTPLKERFSFMFWSQTNRCALLTKLVGQVRLVQMFSLICDSAKAQQLRSTITL